MKGLFFKKKKIGVVSQETLELFRDSEEYEIEFRKRVLEYISANIVKIKASAKEHFSFQEELLNKKNNLAWEKAYEELGLNPDENYHINKKTGEVKLG